MAKGKILVALFVFIKNLFVNSKHHLPDEGFASFFILVA